MTVILRTLLVLIAALTLVSQAAADELRFSYGLGQHDVEYSPSGAAGVDGEWDENRRLELGAYSNLSWIWGFGVSLQQAEIEAKDDSWNLEYDGWSLRTYVGKAPIAGQSFTWEIMGFTGVGLAKGDLSRKDGGPSGDDSSFMYEIGAQTNISFNISQQFLIGVGASYEIVETSLDIGGNNDVEQKGFIYHGFLGYRF